MSTPRKVGTKTPQTARAREGFPGWAPVFLEQLARVPDVRRACEAAQINPTTAYDARRAHEAFAAAWKAALEESLDAIEGGLFRCALDAADFKGNADVARWLLVCHRRSVYGPVTRNENINSNLPDLTAANLKAMSREQLDELARERGLRP